MQDVYMSLYAFNRWANAQMLDACRKLTPEQYTAEPVPGWSSVRFTVWHISVVTDFWPYLAGDPDQSFPTEVELATGRGRGPPAGTSLPDIRSAFCRSSLPNCSTRPGRFKGRGWTAVLPPWVVLPHVVNHTTYHRGQVASKLKRFGIQQAGTDLPYWCATVDNTCHILLGNG